MYNIKWITSSINRILKLFGLKWRMLWEKGAFHILIGNFLTKFVVFFGSIFLVRVLSKESYGKLAYIENIYGYIYILAGMGLANSVLRFVVLAKEKDRELAYYKHAINQGTIFNVFFVIIIAIVGLFYPHPPQFMNTKWLIIAIAISLPFQFITEVNIFTLRAKFDNRRYAIAALISSTMLVAGKYIGALVWDVSGVILSIIIVSFSLAVVFTKTINKIYYNHINPASISRSEQKRVKSYSIQYMITNGIWTLFMLNDIFLLGLLDGNPTTIAEYKVAYVLPGNLAILSGAIGIFVAPYFVKHENDFPWIRNNYLKVLIVSSGLIGSAAIFIMLFSSQIITLLYGANYINIVPVMRLLLISAFINSGLRFTTANLLSAMGQVKYNMIISFIGVILQVVVNFQVIPIFGVKGIAYTSIIVYTLMSLALFIIFAKKYNLFRV